MVDNSIFEKEAEYRIQVKLINFGILISKPIFDQLGADLIALDSLSNENKYLRVQCKGRGLISSKNTNISIPKEYVSDSFVLLLYLKTIENLNLIYCFFPDDIRNWEHSNKSNYIIRLTNRNYINKLQDFKITLEKVNKIKKMITSSKSRNHIYHNNLNDPFLRTWTELNTSIKKISDKYEFDIEWTSLRISSNELLKLDIIDSTTSLQFDKFITIRNEILNLSLHERDQKEIMRFCELGQELKKKIDHKFESHMADKFRNTKIISTESIVSMISEFGNAKLDSLKLVELDRRTFSVLNKKVQYSDSVISILGILVSEIDFKRNYTVLNERRWNQIADILDNVYEELLDIKKRISKFKKQKVNIKILLNSIEGRSNNLLKEIDKARNAINQLRIE